jgi:tRNA(fMet)-specific endonuclease VapC
MKYLLDTNVCVVYLRGKNPLVRARFTAHPPTDLGVCSVVVAELCYGAARSSSPASEQAKVDGFLSAYRSLPFDDASARRYGALRAGLAAAGMLIADLDLAIASIALEHGLTVITHNTKDFSRIPGLALEDWEVP